MASGSEVSVPLGKVKLWDLRGPDNSLITWDLLPEGLSTFDCHPTTAVFAVTSAISPRAWRSQRVKVQSLKEDVTVSSFGVSTGLTAPPSRGLLSSFIPRSNSLAFHPLEMLYGLYEGPVLFICTIDTEEWQEDNWYNLGVNGDNLPDLALDPDNNNDDLEEGGQILYTVFAPAKEVRAEEIHIGSTVSQQLIEAFTPNSVSAQTSVPPWTVDFLDVFEKEVFSSLLEHRT
ncbi:hypothetical protein B0H14DRAFT_3472693 [Mycena olivaceomarginata]|nr:hypothetical protein B0H14DRAFT_3472693 [Mycena olivaceomarginata]